MLLQVNLCRYREIDDSALWRAYRDLLSHDERARLDTFRHDDARLAFLAGRALLRSALASRLGCEPAAVALAIDEWGRPHLAERVLDFNLSHGSGLLALAIGDRGDIGVDTEYSGRAVDVLRLARRYFLDDEIATLEAMDKPARRDHFFRLWTLKEAYVKAVGRGIANTLNTVAFELGDNGGIGARLHNGGQAVDIRCWLFQVLPQHLLAVVSLNAGATATVPRLSEVVPLQDERAVRAPLIGASV